MKILVTGASGLVGSALVPFLQGKGHTVVPARRSAAGVLEEIPLDGVEAVIHLAGENIAGRWTTVKKQRILESRVEGTRRVSEAVARSSSVRSFLCASAVGYYGDRGEEVLTEGSVRGTGFLSDVCRAWEAVAEPVRRRGIRTVHLRFGVILSAKGGALKKMLAPFRWGVGGRIGKGRQFMSWVSLDDVIGAIEHALRVESLEGPVNMVAPRAVTNLEFTKTLGRVLGRPTIFPMPAFAVRLAFGEMGQELLLSGQRVLPAKLEASRYVFRTPDLETALRFLLGAS